MALTWWRLAAAFSAVRTTDLLRILWSKVQWRIWSSSFQPLKTSKQMHLRSDLALPCGSNISWPREKENIKHRQQKILYIMSLGYFKFLLRCYLEVCMLNEFGFFFPINSRICLIVQVRQNSASISLLLPVPPPPPPHLLITIVRTENLCSHK